MSFLFIIFLLSATRLSTYEINKKHIDIVIPSAESVQIPSKTIGIYAHNNSIFFPNGIFFIARYNIAIQTIAFISLAAYAIINTLSVNNLAIKIPIDCGKYWIGEYTATFSIFAISLLSESNFFPSSPTTLLYVICDHLRLFIPLITDLGRIVPTFPSFISVSKWPSDIS